MADPYEAPDGETPIERRERLLNLNNEKWGEPDAEPAAEAEAEPPAQPPRTAPSARQPVKGN